MSPIQYLYTPQLSGGLTLDSKGPLEENTVRIDGKPLLLTAHM